MLIGECWGEQEEREGRPFVGASGQELNRMLGEAGILRSDCYVSNVVNYRPLNNFLGAWVALRKKDITAAHLPLRDRYVLPIVLEGYQRLLKEIEMVQPEVIITVGNLSMWALTGNWGILKWRGSHLKSSTGHRLIPTIHPASVQREWPQRRLVVLDFKRAKRALSGYSPPAWNFRIKPGFAEVMKTLLMVEQQAIFGDEAVWLDFDIETKVGHISCLGFSWSRIDALCIPFMSRANSEGYWSEEEETQIIWKLRQLFTHPKVHIRWQNGLYDAQYIARHWLFVPGSQHERCQDTMISQHSAFCALPKGLSFLGSMYADHYVYWKDEGKNTDGKLTDERNWNYNCQDCVYTREVGEVLTATLAKMNLTEVDAVQQALFWPVLRAMLKGIRVIPENRDRLAADIQGELSSREGFLYSILGHSINVGSPKQMMALFYDDLLQKPVMKRVKDAEGSLKMRPTMDDEALTLVGNREPLLKPICNAVADIRTLNKWLKDFVLMRLDHDGRMRCSFNIAGDAEGKSAPYSYRLSSSENAFGSGGNLQTIPSDKSKSAGKASARGSMDFALPNIRSMFGPDAGCTFFDMDLDRADLQVVAWEANDEILKAALRTGADVHLLNVYVLDGQELPPLEELVEGHPKYPDHRGPRKHRREFAKVFCHATNYVGSAKTVAAHTGRTIHEVDRAQKLWFGAHPGIKNLHTRVEEQIRRHRFVENKFGYRWHIFDRTNDILPEAVAWIPQSTVGGLINRIWLAIYRELPEVEVLLQVHDSLAGQLPTSREEELVSKLKEVSKIVIPYDDPLIIPTGVKISRESWGGCV